MKTTPIQREQIEFVLNNSVPRFLQRISIGDIRDLLADAKELARLREAALAVRKSDCGGWLKDCDTQLFTCRDGQEKRLELMRALDGLYKTLLNNGDGDGQN